MPFVDASVTDEWFCPPGQDVIFTRPWYGTYMACDCTHVYATYYDDEGFEEIESWSYEMI